MLVRNGLRFDAAAKGYASARQVWDARLHPYPADTGVLTMGAADRGVDGMLAPHAAAAVPVGPR